MGKGDNRRPTEIDDATFTDNWCRAFGHRSRTTNSTRCTTCGARIEAIDEHQGLVQTPAGRRRKRSAKDAQE